MRFSATVMLLNGAECELLRAMPRRVRRCGGQLRDVPSRNITVPGSVRNAPEIQLISVVFPEPFGRSGRSALPDEISTLTLSSAVKRRKRLVSADIRSKGGWVSRHHPWLPLRLPANPSDQAMMPSGAATTNNTSITPSTSTFTSDRCNGQQFVASCRAGSRRRPTGPITRSRRSATSRAPRPSNMRLNAVDGRNCRYIAAGRRPRTINAPEMTHASSFSRRVGTPVHFPASFVVLERPADRGNP